MTTTISNKVLVQNWTDQEASLSKIKSAYTETEVLFSPVPSSNQELEEILSYIRKNLFCNSLRVSSVEALFHLNTNKKLKLMLKNALQGRSLQSFIVYHRITLGKRLLLETDVLVSLIAYNLGYESAEAFIVRFNKYYGMYPAHFRKNKASMLRCLSG